MNFKEVISSQAELQNVIEVVQEQCIETYVIGGFVRDLILKRPSKDIDIVCVGSGLELAQMVAEKSQNVKVSYFKNFGTAMIKANDWELEFVGARKESYNRDSRKPIVENGTLEDDQNRRDFTINALAISLNKENFGDVIDPFDGLKAIKRKILKTPLAPDQTFSDDPLRMMRALRFAAQLKFDIDADTFNAINKNKERISIVSQERIIIELNKMILAPTPSYGLKLLFHSGLLHLIFPEMAALHGVEVRDGRTHKDNFFHTLEVLDNVAKVSNDLWLRWAAILHDIAKPPTKRFHPKAGWTFHGHEDKGARMVPQIFKKLKLPLGDNMKFVQKLVRLHLRPIPLVRDEITDSALRRLLFEAGDDIEDLMNLCRADVTSKNHVKVKKYLANFDVVEEKLKKVEEEDKLRNFQPLITGEIIMETFNLSPCKTIGEIKVAIREAILEGKVKNEYNSSYAYMIKEAAKLGLKPVEK